MEHSAADLKSLLTKTQLKDLTAKQTKPLVALGHRVTIGTVLETLSEHGLLSAPIFIADDEGNINPSVTTLIGFVDTWTVLAAFLQSLGNSSEVTEELLESQGAALCARPVLDLFEGGSAVRAAIESGDVKPTCADWDTHDDPSSSLLEVIRSCFLPRTPGTNSLSSWASGAGFSLSAATALAGTGALASTVTSPSARTSVGGHPAASNNGSSPTHPVGHSRHPAASHRILVVNPLADAGHQLSVLSQSDILRFLAAHHESLRPLGKASLAELGLATGSLHLAAGPTASGSGARPPPLTTPGGPGGSNNSIPPSSPKPPLASASYSSAFGGGGSSLLGPLGASPVQENHMINFQRANSSGSGGGPTSMQMSPPASPRASPSPRVSMDRLDRMSASLHSFGGHHSSSGGHRMASRRQLVAVHESVSAFEAFRVLLQQRVSAVAVLAGVGSSVNMRLVNNLSASDLRHLKKGSFGRLALTVKQFLARKPAAPDQAIALKGPSLLPPSDARSGPGSPAPAPRTSIVMAHAPSIYTCQATASLEESVKMLGTPHHGIHRVYVVDPDQRPAGVVTGTDVLSLLSAACSRE